MHPRHEHFPGRADKIQIQADCNASRFWRQVALLPSPVSSQELLFSTTAALQTAASFSGFQSDSAWSYISTWIHQVRLLPASDHQCGFEEGISASHLLHSALLLPARPSKHPAAGQAVHLPMSTMQRSTRAGSSTLLSQVSRLWIRLSLRFQLLPPLLGLAVQLLLGLPLT